MKMDNPHLMMFMLEHGSKPRLRLARQYAAECRNSKHGDELLGILVDCGWAPPPPRSNVGTNSERGGTANGAASWSENDRVGSARGRSDYSSGQSEQGEDSPLHKAVLLKDNGALLAQLLALGENPNVLDYSGTSPLMVAAYCGSVAKVEALLGAGAALNLRRPQEGWTALHAAAVEGHVEVTELLLAASLSSTSTKKSEFSSFFARGFTQCSGEVERGASSPSSREASASTRKTCPPLAVVDVMDDLGKRPLHIAANHNHAQVVEVLLRAGADVNSRDKRGGTPLFYAAREDSAEAVIALLKAGALPDIKNSSGYSALHVAVLKPAGVIVKALITAGASPGIGGEKGPTPLHVACESNTPGTVEALLWGGAVPGHCWNDCLESPLNVACKYGSLNAVKLLLPHLSARQINMRNRTFGFADGGVADGGETPLVSAIRGEYCDESEKIAIVEAVSL